MDINRRNCIKIIGAGGLLVAAGQLGGCAGQSQTAALPWNIQNHNYTNPVLRALSYAILAPNPHNRQPWLIKLNNELSSDTKPNDLGFTLFCQLDRRLPQTDPFDRQITIGLGCFAEVLRIAALEEGYDAVFDWFPKGDYGQRLNESPIAHVKFIPTTNPKDLLFSSIMQRRSNKAPYDLKQSVEPEKLASIHTHIPLAKSTTEKRLLVNLQEISWKALELEMSIPRTHQESVDLMRIGADEVSKQPDGITLQGRMLSLLSSVGMLSREKLADKSTRVFKQGLQQQENVLKATPGYVWIETPGNTRLHQLEAGKQYVRMNLLTTKLGLALHPISQALQEYPEMQAHYKRLNSLLKVEKSSRIQMLARIGYAKSVDPSPRWPLKSRIVNSE